MGTALGAPSGLRVGIFSQRVNMANNCFVCVRRLGLGPLIPLEDFGNVALLASRGSVDACLILDMVEAKSTRLVGHFENE